MLYKVVILTVRYLMSFSDDQLLIAQDYEDFEYMTRKLINGYELWSLKLNVKKTEYMIIGDTLRDLQLENGNGIINSVTEYTSVGVRTTRTEITSMKLMIELIEDEQL